MAGDDDLLKLTWETNEENNLISHERNYILSSIYNVERLNNLYKNLDTVSFLNLLTEYNNLNDRGYSKELLNEKLNTFFSLPIFLFLMVVHNFRLPFFGHDLLHAF